MNDWSLKVLYLIQLILLFIFFYFYFQIFNIKSFDHPPTININNPSKIELNIYNNTRTNALVKYTFPIFNKGDDTLTESNLFPVITPEELQEREKLKSFLINIQNK